MNSFELVCEDLVDEVVSKEIREVVKGMFSQTVDALLVAKQSEDIYQEMVNDVIDDMGVVNRHNLRGRELQRIFLNSQCNHFVCQTDQTIHS